ncbi:MAG: hypothetical protein ABEH77_02420 [Halobacteriaceae archaeon]
MSASEPPVRRPTPAVTLPVLVGGVGVAAALFLSLKFQLFSRSYAPAAGLVGGLLAGAVAARTRERGDGVAWQGVRAGVLATALSFFLFVGFDLLVVLKHGVEPVGGVANASFRMDTLTRLILFVFTEGTLVFLYSVTLLLGSAVGTWLGYTAVGVAGERLGR